MCQMNNCALGASYRFFPSQVFGLSESSSSRFFLSVTNFSPLSNSALERGISLHATNRSYPACVPRYLTKFGTFPSFKSSDTAVTQMWSNGPRIAQLSFVLSLRSWLAVWLVGWLVS